MHVSERNRLQKRITVLLNAADDMLDATVAGEWLREIKDNNPFRRRVLLTAMVVSYARPFSHSNDMHLERGDYMPAGEAGDLHGALCDLWRDKVYAHTDRKGGRSASLAAGPSGWLIQTSRQEFPAGSLDAALALFATQRERFEEEAKSIQLRLDGAAE